MSNTENNKRIAKNTAMLYFRMLLTLVVSLYTSRIVLLTIGIDDFGIYNVVGGFVAMFGFLNSAMASATQRFLSFEIGRKDSLQIQNVFSMSINIHFVIAIIILLFAETIGLWFFNTQLAIPAERRVAAQWVYQFSILALLVNIISVPYNAIIIAHERMNVFAGVSIVEVALKLLIVFMLQWLGYDKLKLYAVLVFGVSIIIRLIYGVYCKSKFKESRFRFYWDAVLFKKLFSHVGWMLFGTTMNMLSGQGINILMNIFFGVTVNAARGIAYSIQSAVTSFVSNFMMAVTPQIIKNYAQNNFEDMYNLVFRSSKFSFFLMFYVSLPVLLLTGTVLQWWLKIVPEHAVIFTQLVIIDLFFSILYSPIANVSQATGKIKGYQIVISIGFFLAFALSYLFFKMGYPSHFAFIIMIVMSFLGLLARLQVLKIQLSFPVQKYYKEVIQRIAFVALISIPIPLVVLYSINNIVVQFFLVIVASVLSTSIGIWFVGINQPEKIFIKSKLQQLQTKLFDNR